MTRKRETRVIISRILLENYNGSAILCPNREWFAMSGKYLYDTNAVINLLKGDAALLSLAEEADVLYISVITILEFLSFKDISESDGRLFLEFCERVEVVDVVHSHHSLIQDIVSIRKKFSIKIPDAIICASARFVDSELITADQQLLSVWGKIDT
jgi:tRNA(fMet)-specific endonuclease VapC